MLAGDLPDLREKALGLAGLRRVGSDAAGLRTEAVFVVGAQGRDSSPNRRKTADLRLWCRSKPCKAKALRKIAARGPSKPWCRNRPPNQCADNNNFQKRPHMVPSSLILPSALSAFSAPPAGNPAGQKPMICFLRDVNATFSPFCYHLQAFDHVQRFFLPATDQTVKVAVWILNRVPLPLHGIFQNGKDHDCRMWR